ncbi:MAG: DUF4158 domain-containing protein [Steroidobacteraceae bacterium]
MDSWHATFLGLRYLPREVTAFEVEVFFQYSAEEARIIEERRRPELKLGLALQIGFLRMSGRLLDAVRMVPPLRRGTPVHRAQRRQVRGASDLERGNRAPSRESADADRGVRKTLGRGSPNHIATCMQAFWKNQAALNAGDPIALTRLPPS